jgi:hypothetical protein
MAHELRTGDSEQLALVDYQLEGLSERITALIAGVSRDEYYDCGLCGTDFHTYAKRGGMDCRDYARPFTPIV